MSRKIMLVDWRARDGSIVGVEIRDGESPGRSYVAADIRYDCPLFASRLAAWMEVAEVVDLRGTEPVSLADGPAAQHLVPGVEPVSHTARQITQERQRKALRLRAPPVPAGPLFGDPTWTQQDMFA